METNSPIPQDEFSRELRKAQDATKQSTLRAESTIHTQDFYGNTESWIVRQFRDDKGDTIAFLQHDKADGRDRLVLPAKVTLALRRQYDQIIAHSRRRAAASAVATKRMKKAGGK